MQPERPRRTAHLLVALMSMLGGVLLMSGGARAQDDPGQLLEDGRRAFERERFEEARERLWEYLDATSNLTGAARMPQADALYMIALMEPDAAVAERHYQIIVDEFPASPVADDALHRLAVLNLVEGDTDLAIQQFEQLRKEYPVSQHQPEIPLWIGQARLAAGEPQVAVETLLDGFSRVKSADLPREISMTQRDALAAEYAHWLARAYTEAGDEATALQYATLLTLDYPDSPQAADAREVLASRGRAAPPGVVASAAGERRPPEQADVPPATPPPDRPAAEVPAPAVEGPAVAVVEPPAGDVGPGAEPARDGEVEDIAVADPVAAAPEGVGRGAARGEEPVAERPVAERPAAEPDLEPEAAPISVQPIRPAEPPPQDREDFEPPAKFGPGVGGADLMYLQVGAFTSATRAADLSKRLKADGFNSNVQIAVVDGRGFYRVRVGPFRASADAQRIDRDRRRLTELGYPAEPVPVTQ